MQLELLPPSIYSHNREFNNQTQVLLNHYLIPQITTRCFEVCGNSLLEPDLGEKAQIR